MKIMNMPPIFMIFTLCFLIQFIRPMKNDKIKNGTAKPSTYAVIYRTPELGLVAAKPITTIRIGPVQESIQLQTPYQSEQIQEIRLDDFWIQSFFPSLKHQVEKHRE